MKQRTLYILMTIGGGLGVMSAFLQTLEKIAALKGEAVIVPCDINSVFSCSTVLSAWQSSVFGFPNSLMCLILFTTFMAMGLAGALGSRLSRGLRLGVQGLSLFTLGFALWFLWQSTYVIGAICIFCLVCFAGLLAVNWAWLRLNAEDLPIRSKAKENLLRFIRSDWDTLIWIALGLMVGLAMYLKFSGL